VIDGERLRQCSVKAELVADFCETVVDLGTNIINILHVC